VEGAVLIGRHCQIGDGARIANSCIDNYTKIGKNVEIENSAIMDRVILEENIAIRKSIIGRQVTILSNPKKQTTIEGFSVVADNVTVAEGCKLIATKVYPHQHVKGEYNNETLIQS
jgi:NDP-sugar pyrophosphorylase family protein